MSDLPPALYKYVEPDRVDILENLKIRFTPDGKTSMRSVFITKSKHWEYEQEWRIFQRIDYCAQRFEHHGEIIHLFDFPPECITGIIVGCRMAENPDRLKRLVRAIKLNPGLSQTLRKIQIAQQDPNKFQLNYVQFSI